MVSPIFSLFHARNAESGKPLSSFTTELMIHYFPIQHMRLSTLLILAVCSNSLAWLGVSVAQLQSIRARRSEVRLLTTQHFFFFPCLWPDRRKKKSFSRVYPKQMSNKKLSKQFFLRFRGYRILQQLIGLCISLFSDVNIVIFGTLFLVAWPVQTKKLWYTQKYWKLKMRDKQI